MFDMPVQDQTAVDRQVSLLIDGPLLSLAAVDVDDFLSVNQTYGREAADAILALVYQTLRESTGEAGFALRSGGDEFLCVLPGTSPEQALLTIEAVRRSLEQPQRIGECEISARISAGIAAFPHHAADAADLVAAAHDALHRAKSGGRNRVAIYVEEKMVLKSNYYPRAQLARLGAVAHALGRTEASLLRDALDGLLDQHRQLV